MAGGARGRGEPGALDADLVRLARRDWERARRVPERARGRALRGARRGPRALARGPRRGRLRRLRAGAGTQLELARAYGACLAEDGQGTYQALLDDYDYGLRTDELRRLFGALGEQLCRRSSRRPRARGRSPPRGARARLSRRGRVDPARVGVERRGLARRRLRAPVLDLDGAQRPAHHDALRGRRHRVAAQLAARVRPRALRAPDRPRARADEPRARHLDVDPRVAEQALGEPRRAPSARSRRCSPTSSRPAATTIEPGRAARRRSSRVRAVADPRLRRPAHLPAAHRAALRARARADRRRRSRSPTCPRRGTTACAACSASRCPRRARLPAGRALERGRVRLLPELRDGLPDRRVAVGGARARAGPAGRRARARRGRSDQGLAGRARAPLRPPARHASRWSSRRRAAGSRSSRSCATPAPPDSDQRIGVRAAGNLRRGGRQPKKERHGSHAPPREGGARDRARECRPVRRARCAGVRRTQLAASARSWTS